MKTVASEPATFRLLASATRAEQFSTWALRTWWRSFPELQLGWSDLMHGFRVCGVQPALESCHRFCSIVLTIAGGGQGLACPHFARIVPMEERLLGALAMAETGEPDFVESLLLDVVPTAAARLAAPQAIRYARVLASAGLEWPQRAKLVAADPRSRTFSAPEIALSQRLH
jgi:hypothetical protein